MNSTISKYEGKLKTLYAGVSERLKERGYIKPSNKAADKPGAPMESPYVEK